MNAAAAERGTRHPAPARAGRVFFQARIGAALTAAAECLRAAGIENPRLAAELLLADVLGCRRLELPLRYAETLSAAQARRYDAWLRRAAAGEPLAYVLGTAQFLDLLLRVDRRALIPRPETEGLVETVLACEPLRARRPLQVADVGTGSGCIAIALARRWPHAEILATDASADALELARENAAHAGVAGRIRWRHADLLTGGEPGSLDAVVANLPYVPTSAWAELPRSVRDFEPRMALDGGPDGLRESRRLVRQALQILRKNGWLFLECAPDQAAALRREMMALGFTDVLIRQDLGGRDRVVLGRKP